MTQFRFASLVVLPAAGILSRCERRQAGISLLEVLFSMLLVTVGLFGAIALLPVAAHQAKRGRLYDAQAVAGETATAEFFVREMARTRTWIAPVDPGYFKAFRNIRPWLDMSGNPVLDGMGNPIYEQELVDYFPVVGYCIDPLFVDANRPSPSQPPNSNATYRAWARYFPYYRPDESVSVSAHSDPSFSVRMERITLARTPNEPYQFGAMNQPGKPGVDDNKDQMITDRDMATMVADVKEIGWPGSDDFRYPMTNAHAQSIFYSEDDLYFDRVKDASVPASQVYSRLDDGSGTVTNMRRLTEGNLSWFATLAPRNVNNPDPTTNDDYMLSIVVMNRRPYTTAGLVMDPVSTVQVPCAERVAEVFWVSGGTGINGGEVILRARPGREDGDLDVRAGDWIMLSGSFTSSFVYGSWTNPTPAPPVPTDKRPIYQWYRVVDADPDVQTRTVSGSDFRERHVTLAGADWPQAMVTTEDDFGTKQSVTQATLVSGVVAVYEKSVRLSFK